MSGGFDFEHLYLSASGPAYNDCVFLGQRFDTRIGFKPPRCETWLLRNQPLAGDTCRVSLDYGIDGWLAMAWRSPAGVVWLAHAMHEVRVNATPGVFGAWQTQGGFEAVLSGIWGLADDCVWAWGGVFRAPAGRMYHWNGQAWREMPAPGDVIRVHALAPDLLLAVGHDGLIARWDGHAWHRYVVPTSAAITGVFAAGPDEYYAVAQDHTLWEGSSHGFRVRARDHAPLHDVCAWQGRVWVAGGRRGLLALVPRKDALEVVEKDLDAIGFDARGELVVSCPRVIAGTADGTKFGVHDRGTLEELTRGRAPLWAP